MAGVFIVGKKVLETVELTRRLESVFLNELLSVTRITPEIEKPTN